MKKDCNIAFIGAGNVAVNLAVALYNKGYNIVNVTSANIVSARKLSEKINAVCDANSTDYSNLKVEADIYIIAVTDTVLAEISKSLQLNNKIVLHTSGSTNMNILKNATENYGVLYPLQTFSKEELIDFKDIPVCIEANNNNTLEVLKAIAGKITNKVCLINSEQRKILHIAAVFASNFTNFMYLKSKELLELHNLDFNLLKPLIKQTAEKIENRNPEDVLTGPARRNDEIIIKSHLEYLNQNPEMHHLYQILSEQIIKFYYKS